MYKFNINFNNLNGLRKKEIRPQQKYFDRFKFFILIS